MARERGLKENLAKELAELSKPHTDFLSAEARVVLLRAVNSGLCIYPQWIMENDKMIAIDVHKAFDELMRIGYFEINKPSTDPLTIVYKATSQGIQYAARQK